MSPKSSFWTLVLAVVAVGFLFFQVIQPFIVPLLCAVVVAILIRPLYEHAVERLAGRRRITAALFTLIFLLGVLLPIALGIYFAGRELMDAGEWLAEFDPESVPLVQSGINWFETRFPNDSLDDVRDSAFESVQGMTGSVYDQSRAMVSNIVGFVVGLAVMAFALYYFLADGPGLLRAIQAVTPMENDDENTLIEEFGRVCRGVVLATIVCALVQAVLAVIGFAIFGVTGVWLLGGATLISSMIPFIGAAGVWAPVAIWLAFDQQILSGVLLALYGALVISTADNFVRAHVIHSSAGLHPLVALVSVLGGLQFIGVWGIFAGPIIAAFFYALLKILHDRLQVAPEEPEAPPDGLRTSAATLPEPAASTESEPAAPQTAAKP
ncbi:putative inner membrane protein [Maioricimonas rarisocia]|uniref:Putative inner membrane protein n=1 Tax=Maioricimonas rarisocia TaxID=2528026 RepID=A0A517Z666_9PLAN|nr:AI-2E family transporter [Maioricimonas rarisocia]QDU37954.1 putative inner membrane protein [Maioricimonas rarisocia]